MLKAIILFVIFGVFILFLIIICILKITKQLKEKHQQEIQTKLEQIEELKKNYLFNKIIKTLQYDEKTICSETKCSICLLNYVFNKSKICLTPCNHVFHFYCLKKYIINENKKLCPLCNNDLLSTLKEEDNFYFNVQIIPLDENDNPNNEQNEIEQLKLAELNQ
jgi:hypothetical protein